MRVQDNLRVVLSKIVSANQMCVLLQTPEIADDSAAGTEQTFSSKNALEF